MGVYEYIPTSMSYEGNNRGKREARTGREHATRETKTTKVIKLDHVAAYSILKHHNLNHHYDYYWTISKIIFGILTMVYSAVNHSYDSKRTIKIISGITTMIYSSINHSYDSNRTNKIISGIITVLQ